MKTEVSSGEHVKIVAGAKEYEGIVMPRSELERPGILSLKLTSGYNIGLLEKDISEIKKLGSREKLESFPSKPPSKNPKLPSIDILGCGGTIASRVDYVTGGVKSAMSPEEILFSVPELGSVANINDARIILNVWSEAMNHKDWETMAKETKKSLDSGVRGVVLMHGTDTMHYSSAALSFMLPEISGPVVFTGAQRSSDRGSSDAVENLLSASILAAKSDIGVPVLCMHETSSDGACAAHLGTKVRKLHSSRRNAFTSVNASPVARVLPNERKLIMLGDSKPLSDSTKIDTRFDSNIALLKAFPGAKGEMIDSLVANGTKGIVIEATGLGQVNNEWMKEVTKAIKDGVTICFAAQTIYGRLDPYVYEPARRMLKAGVIYCEDMLSETAYVKLGCVLGQKLDPKEEMRKSWVGEISE